MTDELRERAAQHLREVLRALRANFVLQVGDRQIYLEVHLTDRIGDKHSPGLIVIACGAALGDTGGPEPVVRAMSAWRPSEWEKARCAAEGCTQLASLCKEHRRDHKQSEDRE